MIAVWIIVISMIIPRCNFSVCYKAAKSVVNCINFAIGCHWSNNNWKGAFLSNSVIKILNLKKWSRSGRTWELAASLYFSWVADKTPKSCCFNHLFFLKLLYHLWCCCEHCLTLNGHFGKGSLSNMSYCQCFIWPNQNPLLVLNDEQIFIDWFKSSPDSFFFVNCVTFEFVLSEELLSWSSPLVTMWLGEVAPRSPVPAPSEPGASKIPKPASKLQKDTRITPSLILLLLLLFWPFFIFSLPAPRLDLPGSENVQRKGQEHQSEPITNTHTHTQQCTYLNFSRRP